MDGNGETPIFVISHDLESSSNWNIQDLKWMALGYHTFASSLIPPKIFWVSFNQGFCQFITWEISLKK